MSEAMAVQGSPASVVHDFDHAYRLGRLCGEVRILKWGVGVAFVAILGSVGVLYQAIDAVGIKLIETAREVSVLRSDTVAIRKDVAAIDARVATIEDKVETIEERVETIEVEVAAIKEDVAVLKEDVAGLKEDVAGLKEDVAGLKEDVAGLKEDVAVLKEDVAGLKEDVADLRAMHSSSIEGVRGGHGNSRGFPKHVDSAGQPVPPARTTPPA